MANIIEIRPIQRKKWHSKTGSEDFARPLVLECYVDRKRSRYMTGLSEDDRQRLEKSTGYDLGDIFTPDKPHPFYSSINGRVKLENKTNIFHMDNPLHEIKVKFLMQHPMVANSMDEYENGDFPGAQFVIYDDNADIEKKVQKIELQKKVFRKLDKMDSLSKKQLYQILVNKSASDMSDDFLEAKLHDAIGQAGYERTYGIMERTKETNYNHALLLEGVQLHVLNRKGDIFYYMDDYLGDVNEAIEFLKDPKNSEYKAAIVSKIEQKKSKK